MVDEYRAAAKNIRDTAKWTLTTLGAVGTLLISGIGLSSLAKVHTPGHLALALGGLVLALIGVGLSIALTASVLRPSTITFDQLVAIEGAMQPPESKAAPEHLRSMFPASEAKLQGLADSYAQLRERNTAALGQRATALRANYDNPEQANTATQAQAAKARADLYGGPMDNLTAQAAYLEIRSRVHGFGQSVAAVLVVLGVCGFAVTLALPTWKSPDLHGATLRNMQLDGVVLQRADFSGMTLRNVGLRDADLRNAKFNNASLNRVDLTGANVTGASFTSVIWSASICPDGTPSDADGHRCTGHDTARAASLAPPPVPHPKKHKHKHKHKKLKPHGARARH